MKYIKRPIMVEAVKFNGSSSHRNQINAWIKGEADAPPEGGIHTRDVVSFEMVTDSGALEVRAGTWIIKGVKGEFYPCSDDVFERTYDPAESPAPLKE